MRRHGPDHKRALRQRDLLRDYCLSAADLQAQFARFKRSGSLSFSIIQGIIGESFSKGMLWRLKDTAHHLFDGDSSALRSESPASPAVALDWAIGFLFHQCIIIMEAAYQMQQYRPVARALGRGALLAQAESARQDMDSFIERAEILLLSINRLFCEYLAGEENNRPLARFIHDQEPLLLMVFKDLHPRLLESIFGARREKFFLEAAASLFEAGRMERAEQAVRRALAINPACRQAEELLKNIAASGLSPGT